MKRNLILGIATLCAASMLCGFDSAETADSILQKMQEASLAATGVDMDMVMDVNVDVNVGDGETTSTLGIAMGGDFAIDASMEPFAMKMEGKMSLSALGSGQDIEMKMYGLTNEAGAFETYVYAADSVSGEAEWVYDVEEGMDFNALIEQSQAVDPAELKEWGMEFALAPEAVDVNGTECYELSTTIDSTTLEKVLEKASEMAGEDLASDEDISIALALFEGLKFNFSYCVDTATYLPVSMHMDMNGSDLSTANSLIASLTALDENMANTTIEIVLNNVSVDVAVAYGDIEPITVPQEALDAIAAGEALNASEVLDDIA